MEAEWKARSGSGGEPSSNGTLQIGEQRHDIGEGFDASTLTSTTSSFSHGNSLQRKQFISMLISNSPIKVLYQTFLIIILLSFVGFSTASEYQASFNEDIKIMASSQAGKTQTLNVFKKPLALFSKQPMTGFYRNGYCDVGPDDTGNHSVAATLTDPFLDFTASRGNNLRSIGLTAGCKWCLCAGRWKEAVQHANSNVEAGDGAKASVVPKVHLQATSEKALNVVGLEELKKYAADSEV